MKVERIGGADATVTINAQSCNESSCSMVRDLKIAIPVGSAVDDAAAAAGLIEGLVEVAPNP